MADQNYEIQLNLKVNDSELRNAEERIRNLGNGNIPNGRGRIGSEISGTRYKWIPSSQRPSMAGAARFFSSRYGASKGDFLSNVNEAYRRSYIFRHNFLGNMVTMPGMLRNLSNFGSVIGQIGKIAMSAVPALGKLSASISTLVIAKGIQYGVSGASLLIGNKLLGNENIAQGAANLMQMGMARKGLGGPYQSSLNEATRIAAEYGFSRTGILNTISMLSGLDIGGGRTLSQKEAARIATQAGKIAHVGSAPYERVAINLQQILGQQTTSTRDLRELITAAPIIATIAQRSMKRNNVTMGLFDYLKDKKNLISILNEFDSWVESNPFMQSRGKVALYKENFYMALANMDPSVWEKISDGLRVFYDQMGRNIPMLIKTIANSIDHDTIREGVKSITTSIEAIGTFVGWIGKFIGAVSDGVNWINLRVSSIITRPVTGIIDWINRGTPRFTYTGATYNPSTDSIMYGSDKTWFGRSEVKRRIAEESIDEAIRKAKERALENVPLSRRGEMYSKLIPVYSPGTNSETMLSMPVRFRLPSKDELGTDNIGFTNTSNLTTRDELSDISKGARGLIINFNREIVNMPVNIDQVNDGTDIADRLRDSLYDVIVRGLNISLNNATGAI